METMTSGVGDDDLAVHLDGAARHLGLRYGELVERRAARQPHRTAFICNGERMTYGELLTRILAAAAFLREQGIGSGDRIVCLAENRIEIFVALYACSRAGAVFTPAGAASTASEVRHVIEDLDASAILVSARTAPVAVEAIGSGGSIPVFLLHSGPGATLPSLPVERSSAGPAVQPDAGTPALIVYTSGTTGRPKGVVLSHSALFFNTVNTLLGLDIRSDEITLVNTPLSHIAALNSLAINTLHKGGTVVLDSNFDATRCLTQIAEHRVTTMFAVPAMLALMEQAMAFGNSDLSSLRWILGGGAPMPPAVVAAWARRGVPVLSSFGMTEAGPSVSFRRQTDAADKAMSSGTPALLTDVRIVTQDGTESPAGEVGHVLVRGPHTATGYWRNPAATGETFRDGWLHTGDRGYFDTDGDLCISGRAKDTIITGGENVDPAEVEDLVLTYPGVREAAVVGRPDPVWGEIVTAVVVSQSDIELDELRAFLRPHLAPFKLPRRIERRTALPRSPVGKVIRSQLKD